MTITIEQQKRLDVIEKELKKSYEKVQGLIDKTHQLNSLHDSLRNSNNNIHGTAGADYVEGAIGYIEQCLEEGLQPHVRQNTENGMC